MKILNSKMTDNHFIFVETYESTKIILSFHSIPFHSIPFHSIPSAPFASVSSPCDIFYHTVTLCSHSVRYFYAIIPKNAGF